MSNQAVAAHSMTIKNKLAESGIPYPVWSNKAAMHAAGLSRLIPEIESMAGRRNTLFYIRDASPSRREYACAALSKAMLVSGADLRFARLAYAVRYVQQYNEAAYAQPEAEASLFVRGIRDGFLAIPNLFMPILGTLDARIAIDMQEFLTRHMNAGGCIIAAGAASVGESIKEAGFSDTLSEVLNIETQTIPLDKKDDLK